MQPPSSRFYEFGPFRVDTVKRVLLREGEPVSLSPKAFDTLLMLVQHPGEVLEKDRLMDLLWPDSAVEEANLPLNISALRKALGETPNERGYITTIPGRGYRFGAAVQVVGGEEPDLIMERHQRANVVIREHDEGVDPERYLSERLLRAAASAANRWKSIVVCAAALGLLGAVVVVFSSRREVAAERSPALVKSLAVLPFKPLVAASGDDYLGLGLADSLIARLSNLKEVIVRPTSSVSGRSLEGKDLVDIGRKLKVEAVLESWIQRSGDTLRLTVYLVRVQDGSYLWADTFDEKEADIFALEDALAERVAAALIPRLTGEEKRTLAKRETDNTEAYLAYSKGRALWSKKPKGWMKEAIEDFEKAVEKDPNYALAYSGLADCYRLQVEMPPREVLQKAKDYALRALEIDDSLPEAHVSLATIKFQYDLDWPGADSEYRRAIELNPNYTYAHNTYAIYLSLCGRFDEAAAEIKRARELDPADHMSYRAGAYLSYVQGHVDQAIEAFRTLVEIEPHFVIAQRELGLAYERRGMYEEALKALQISLNLPGNFFRTTNQADIGQVYAVWGKRTRARKILEELKEQSKRRYVSPMDIALIYAGLGETETAVDWLYKAYEDRSYWLPRLKVEPRLDNCRSDPRFQDLLRKIGLQ